MLLLLSALTFHFVKPSRVVAAITNVMVSIALGGVLEGPASSTGTDVKRFHD
jgi:hypothetical protein